MGGRGSYGVGRQVSGAMSRFLWFLRLGGSSGAMARSYNSRCNRGHSGHASVSYGDVHRGEIGDGGRQQIRRRHCWRCGCYRPFRSGGGGVSCGGVAGRTGQPVLCGWPVLVEAQGRCHRWWCSSCQCRSACVRGRCTSGRGRVSGAVTGVWGLWRRVVVAAGGSGGTNVLAAVLGTLSSVKLNGTSVLPFASRWAAVIRERDWCVKSASRSACILFIQ
jgi:hypothetical protein